MVQVIEPLPSKYKNRRQIPVPPGEKEREERKGVWD
jgi:hypothetical protein